MFKFWYPSYNYLDWTTTTLWACTYSRITEIFIVTFHLSIFIIACKYSIIACFSTSCQIGSLIKLYSFSLVLLSLANLILLSLLSVIVVVNRGIATYFSNYYTYLNTAYVHCFALKLFIIMLPFSLSLMMLIEYWLLP